MNDGSPPPHRLISRRRGRALPLILAAVALLAGCGTRAVVDLPRDEAERAFARINRRWLADHVLAANGHPRLDHHLEVVLDGRREIEFHHWSPGGFVPHQRLAIGCTLRDAGSGRTRVDLLAYTPSPPFMIERRHADIERLMLRDLAAEAARRDQ